MFSFLNLSKDRFPLLNVRALDAWLEQQPVNNVLGLQEEAVGLLRALLTFQRAPDPHRLEAIFAPRMTRAV